MSGGREKKVSSGAPYKSISELCKTSDYVLLARQLPSTSSAASASSTSTTSSTAENGNGIAAVIGVGSLIEELKALRLESAATTLPTTTTSPVTDNQNDDDGPPIVEEPAMDALGLRAFEAGVETHLRAHKFTAAAMEIMFSPTLNSKQRMAVHSAAGRLSLAHESYGMGRARAIVVSDPSKFTDDKGIVHDRVVVRAGHVYLEGPNVDAAGAIGAIPSSWKQNRVARDGPHYHITLFHTSQAQVVFATQPAFKGLNNDAAYALLIRQFETCTNDWIDLGLGRAMETGNQTFYRVIHWPAANAVRVALGAAPADLHITVGFQRADIHNVPKSSILPADFCIVEQQEDNGNGTQKGKKPAGSPHNHAKKGGKGKSPSAGSSTTMATAATTSMTTTMTSSITTVTSAVTVVTTSST